MKKLWHFLSRPQNLAVLAAIGAVIAFFWKDVIGRVTQHATADNQAASTTPPVVNQTAHAGSGGIAINATGAARVNVNPKSDSADDSSSPNTSVDTHP